MPKLIDYNATVPTEDGSEYPIGSLFYSWQRGSNTFDKDFRSFGYTDADRKARVKGAARPAFITKAYELGKVDGAEHAAESDYRPDWREMAAEYGAVIDGGNYPELGVALEDDDHIYGSLNAELAGNAAANGFFAGFDAAKAEVSA